jgi:hypothetical protein
MKLKRCSTFTALLSVALIGLFASCSSETAAETPIKGGAKDGAGLVDVGDGGSTGTDATDSTTGNPDTTDPKPDTVVVIDTYVAKEGEFGYPCESGDECDSDWCIQTAEGKVCSEACFDSCAPGWTCEEVSNTGGDLTFICVPRFSRLCDPCSSNQDCVEYEGLAGSQCIDYGPLGKFCGAVCTDTQGCPTGYQCEKLPTSEKTQCVPVTESGASRACGCSELARDLGKSTTCFATNDYGICYGFRECASSGLSDCSSQLPGIEVCNGVDDNCDNQVDNITIPEQCEVKNTFGTCYGVLKCNPGLGTGSCDAVTPLVEVCDGVDTNCDGVPDDGFADSDGDLQADCVDEDDDNDTILDGQDNCQFDSNFQQKDHDGDQAGDACDPDDDNDNTPDVEDCEPFNDAIFPSALEACDQIDNNCNGITDENLCDDGEACTDDSCQSDGSCVNSNNNKACDDGSVCTQVDVCNGGVCKGNNPLACDDGNPCTTDVCDDVGGCIYTANTAPCEDGNLCTENDTCQGGTCVKGTVTNCDDDDPCTNELGCSPATGCQYNPTSGAPCEYGGQGSCGQGICSAGFCQPTDGAPCTIGGGKCTSGTCQGGFCIHKDGGLCTTNSGKCPQGTCSEGTCFINSGQICETQIEVDLCNDIDAAGNCSAAGQCVVSSPPPGLSCPGCAGICVSCFIQLCIPFGIF